MKLRSIKDRQALAVYFRQDISLHAYSLGDLDDFYWPDTICIGEVRPGGVKKVVVLYHGEDLPVLLAFDRAGNLDQDFFASLM